MMDLNLINSPEDAFYFKEASYKSVDDEIRNETKHFLEYNKTFFIDEFKNYTKNSKQSGYSKSKECNYLAIILVLENTGNGEFIGFNIRSTYLVDSNNKILDVNNNCDDYDERIATVYHPLPDGKIIEIPLTEAYKDSLDQIYEKILNVRKFYNLSQILPEKSAVISNNKMKI